MSLRTKCRIKQVKKRSFKHELALMITSGSLQSQYLRYILWFTQNWKEANQQQVYHQQRRAWWQPGREEVKPSPQRRWGWAALGKKSAHVGAAQGVA